MKSLDVVCGCGRYRRLRSLPLLLLLLLLRGAVIVVADVDRLRRAGN